MKNSFKSMKKPKLHLEPTLKVRDPRTRTDWSRTQKNLEISDRTRTDPWIPAEDMLRDALRPLETSKILDSGEIIHTITREDISNFLTTFGDVLSDDDMKDFCAEFDGINSGMIFFKTTKNIDG